ncbi:hypothetical protein BC833DRAFT_574039 [Globomyces pollinis-pini]|nr:hypothetical protein BC833DRAFT_574039 [Globomyces pollinis-pini]
MDYQSDPSLIASPKRTHYIQTHYESQTHLTQFVTDQVDRVKSFKYDSEPSLNNIKHQSRRKSKSTSKIQYVVVPTLTANKFNSTFAKRLSIKSIANQSSKTGIFRNGKISNPLRIGGLSVTIDPKSPIPAQANLSQPNSPVHLTDFEYSPNLECAASLSSVKKQDCNSIHSINSPIFLDGSPKYSLGHFDFDRVSNPFDLGSTNQSRTPFDLEKYANMQDEQDVCVENKESGTNNIKNSFCDHQFNTSQLFVNNTFPSMDHSIVHQNHQESSIYSASLCSDFSTSIDEVDTQDGAQMFNYLFRAHRLH